jgi:hypothetical protein
MIPILVELWLWRVTERRFHRHLQHTTAPWVYNLYDETLGWGALLANTSSFVIGALLVLSPIVVPIAVFVGFFIALPLVALVFWFFFYTLSPANKDGPANQAVPSQT